MKQHLKNRLHTFQVRADLWLTPQDIVDLEVAMAEVEHRMATRMRAELIAFASVVREAAKEMTDEQVVQSYPMTRSNMIETLKNFEKYNWPPDDPEDFGDRPDDFDDPEDQEDNDG